MEYQGERISRWKTSLTNTPKITLIEPGYVVSEVVARAEHRTLGEIRAWDTRGSNNRAVDGTVPAVVARCAKCRLVDRPADELAGARIMREHPPATDTNAVAEDIVAEREVDSEVAHLPYAAAEPAPDADEPAALHMPPLPPAADKPA